MERATLNRLLWGAALGLVAFAGWTAWRAWSSSPEPARRPDLLETAHAPALAGLPTLAPAVDDGWILDHFGFPLAPQGPPPEGWSLVEASLDPAMCGACHPQQHADWQTSWHAGAMGPGVMGQLVDWDGTDDQTVDQCQTCHAPLAEQDPRVGGVANPVYDPAARDDGLTCAGCHVRAWTRYGPPKADGSGPISNAPHGGFVARAEFQDSRFCEPCHDFRPGQKALEGKLLQETWQEWARTSYAAEGVSCQDCHMPAGRHLWRGIHDPELVRSGMTAALTVALVDGRVRGELAVTNTGTGHRMPTYTTPQLTLILEQVDAAGTAIPDTRVQGAIARYVKPNLSEEYFDTRLLPGETHRLPYALPRAPGAAGVRARVECWPDEAYRRFYEIKLRDPEYGPRGRAQVQAALANSVKSRFLVWEELRPLP